MRSDDELTDLLHTASRAIGTDARPDPRALIWRVRHRRQMVGLALTAAVALLAVAAIPSVLHRSDGGAINVAAGSAEGGVLLDPQPTEASATLPGDPTTTIAASLTTASAVPAAATPTPSTPPGPTTAPSATTLPTPTTSPPQPPTAPSTPTTRGSGVPPTLISASGNAAAPRVLLRFSRPVVPGDGPDFDRPFTTPTSQDTYMAAMQLVVHQSDSTCSNPQGNAHEYQAGVGTDTLTVDATSLVVGTTYISISPGFAKSADDGTPMAWVRCIPIIVKG